MMDKAEFLTSLLKAKLLNRNVPFFVFFTVTNRCNGACSYCFGKYYERYRDEKERELSTAQIFSIVDQLAEAGTKRIGLSGGEPLLREDIGEIISYIKDQGIGCGLNTNGFLVPRKMNLLRIVDNVTISLDGDKEAHDANRGEGTYEKAMEAIRMVQENKIPLHVSTVITKNNMHSIDYVLNLARDMGFFAQISPLYRQFWGEKSNNSPEQLEHHDFIEIFNKIIAYKKNNYPVFYSSKTYQNILKWPDFSKDRLAGKKPEFEHARCYMGKYLCTIDANGNVYPCAQLDGFHVKNCIEVGFDEAFKEISEHNCRACMWACYNEYNLLFALNPSAVINTVRNSLHDLISTGRKHLGRLR